MRESNRIISLSKHVRRGACCGSGNNSYYSTSTPVRMRSSDKLTNVFCVKGRTTHAVDVNRNWVKARESESIDFGRKSSQEFLVNPACHIDMGPTSPVSAAGIGANSGWEGPLPTVVHGLQSRLRACQLWRSVERVLQGVLTERNSGD